MLLVLAVFIAVIFAVIVLYNRFVKYRNRVEAAWSDIDVQLKRRHDLVPSLVTAVKAYASHERATLEAVTSLREQARLLSEPAQKASAESALNDGVLRVLAVAEAYPELKANHSFTQLQSELVGIEDTLQKARRYYNGSVREYNNIIEMFPNHLLAAPMGFRVAQFFSTDDIANPKLEFRDEP